MAAPAAALSLVDAWRAVFGAQSPPGGRAAALDALRDPPRSTSPADLAAARRALAAATDEAYAVAFGLAERAPGLAARLWGAPRQLEDAPAGETLVSLAGTLGTPLASALQLALRGVADRAATFVSAAIWRGGDLELEGGPRVQVRLGWSKDGSAALLLPAGQGAAILHVRPEALVGEATAEVARRLAEAQARHRGAPDPERAGELAALAVRLATFATAGAAERAAAASQVEAAVARLGGPEPGVDADGRLGRALGPVLAAQVARSRYLMSPRFDRREGGAPAGVRLWGTDTRLQVGALSQGSAGHIMATRVDGGAARGEHYSYGPVAPGAAGEASKRRYWQLLDAGVGVAPRRVGVTPAVGPFLGAPGFNNLARVGMLHELAADPNCDRPPSWSYVLDPGFVRPDLFDEAVRRERALEEADPAGRDFVLATSVPAGGPGWPEAPVQSQADGWAPEHDGGGPSGRRPVDAANCTTALLALLWGLRTKDGAPVLGPDDLAILGLRPDGRAHPGRDVRPQDLFEHLRWREHLWRTAREAAA